MAIVITAGTNTETGGASSTNSISVTAPSLAAGDIHIIAASTIATAPALSTPTNYTLLSSQGLQGASNAIQYFWYRIATGTVASGSVVLAFVSGLGKIAAAQAKITGANTTTPFPVTPVLSISLTASTVTPTAANQVLLTMHSFREANATPSAGFSFTPASGMTEVADVSTTTNNGVTQIGTMLASQTTTNGVATGTKAATVSAPTTGGAQAAMTILIAEGTAVPPPPAGPVSFLARSPVATTGGVHLANLAVSAPTLSADEAHLMFVTISANGGLLDTPAGYTQLGTAKPLTTSGGSSSSSAVLFCFYRQGPAAGGTVTLSFPSTPSPVVGKMAVVHGLMFNLDPVAPFELYGAGDYLTAPSLPASSADLLLVGVGVREGIDGNGSITIAPGAGLTEASESLTAVTNLTTQVACEVSQAAVSAPGATGAKTATTTATMTGATELGVAGTMAVLVNAGTAVQRVPGAPVITTVPGNTQVTVNWTAPSWGGSVITDYTLQRKSGAGSFTTIGAATIDGSSTSYTDTGLTNGTVYTYRLLATNAIGDSAYSAEVTATPAAASSTGYAAVVLATAPDHYYPLNSTFQLSDKGASPTPIDANAVTGTVPIGSSTVGGSTVDAAKFTGAQMLEIPNSQDFSVTKTKELTVMLHITIDDYDHPSNPDQFYHPLHKTEAGKREWEIRYYDSSGLGDSPPRPRRHSAYYFAPVTPSRGPGSYAQPANLVAGQASPNMTDAETTQTAPGVEHCIIAQYWTTGSGTNPGGIKIFFNGRATDTDAMSSGPDGASVPGWTSQNVRIGHDQMHGTWLTGRIRRIGFWNRLLTQTEIDTLTSTTNRALAEGTIGTAPITTAPGPPLNVSALRSGTSSAAGTVSWTPPTTSGGSAITGYVVSHDNGGIGTPFTSSLLSASTRSLALTLLPNAPINVQVKARNAAGDSSPGVDVMDPYVALPLMGTVTDTFNAGVDSRRHFDSDVTQVNGELEWAVVSTTKRGTWIRGDMRGQSFFHLVAPSGGADTVTCLFVRSTANPAKSVRLAYLNGTLVGRYDDTTADPSPALRLYNAASDKYWRIVDSNGQVALQTSIDGVSWISIGRAPFATPSWFDDVQCGVEAYTGTAI
jgi:hypothetical protein